MTIPRATLSAVLLAAAICAAGNDARAAGLSAGALTLDHAIVAQTSDAARALDARPPTVHEPVSPGVAVTLAIIPGFGLGHYYAYDETPGLTFLVLDATLTALLGSTFLLQMLKVAPTYTKVALIAIPAIYGAAKVIQVVTVLDAVEAANNRTMRPAGLRHVPEHCGMVTIASF